MTPERFDAITARFDSLRVAVLGDFCLDRYLEIDPARKETSLETGLPVHNVLNVRPQPGGAGTIVNNLSALGVAKIIPVGFVGDDGEGFELWRALERVRGVELAHFLRTEHRHTFTYCKPLVLHPGQPPQELNRLDVKNWTPTPEPVQALIIDKLTAIAGSLDALVILDQVALAETGVVTQKVLHSLESLRAVNPSLVVLADCRRGLRGYPPVIFKMNAAELAALAGAAPQLSIQEIKDAARSLARANQHDVFVTLAERGLLGATAEGELEHVAAWPLRGEIDVVGAGDAVSANLALALAAGADLREALELANAAASIVIHKLGTTGTASLAELGERLLGS